MKSVGGKIKAARKDIGLTQDQLAQKSGVATITIRQYETGKRQPRFEQLQKIADALEIPIAFFTSMTELEIAFSTLNKSGQVEAIKRIKELAQLPQYIDQEGK